MNSQTSAKQTNKTQLKQRMIESDERNSLPKQQTLKNDFTFNRETSSKTWDSFSFSITVRGSPNSVRQCKIGKKIKNCPSYFTFFRIRCMWSRHVVVLYGMAKKWTKNCNPRSRSHHAHCCCVLHIFKLNGKTMNSQKSTDKANESPVEQRDNRKCFKNQNI